MGVALVWWALLGVGLIAAAIWDVRARRVPNALNFAIALTGLGAQGWHGGWHGLLQGGLGIAVGFALIVLPFALRLYRGGDAKLVIALGAWLGPASIAWAFGFGVVIGGLLGGLMLLRDRETRARVSASVKAAIVTQTMPQVEPDRTARQHVPMAVAFGLGAVLALVI
ncbi:MAG: prepilin peptidase CpaA [Bradymonadia bacterium]